MISPAGLHVQVDDMGNVRLTSISTRGQTTLLMSMSMTMLTMLAKMAQMWNKNMNMKNIVETKLFEVPCSLRKYARALSRSATSLEKNGL